MKTKVKEIILKDEVYHRHLTLLIGGDVSWLKTFASNKLGLDLTVSETANGCHFDHTKNGYIYNFIWLQSFTGTSQDIATLAHEIIHFTYFTLDSLQIPIVGNDEVFAYYFQSYFQRALKHLKVKP